MHCTHTTRPPFTVQPAIRPHKSHAHPSTSAQLQPHPLKELTTAPIGSNHSLAARLHITTSWCQHLTHLTHALRRAGPSAHAHSTCGADSRPVAPVPQQHGGRARALRRTTGLCLAPARHPASLCTTAVHALHWHTRACCRPVLRAGTPLRRCVGAHSRARQPTARCGSGGVLSSRLHG
jgi:hypothetical protein